MAKPQKIKEGSSKPVWSDDAWLQEHAGETLNLEDDKKNTTDAEPANVSHFIAIIFNALSSFVFIQQQSGGQI